MKRKIFCRFFNHYDEGLEKQTYPGKLGRKIYDNISKKAWLKWMKTQTLIINEKKLNMFNIEDRKYLENEMIKFFFE